MRSRRQISDSCAAAVLALALLIPALAGAQAVPAAPTAQVVFPGLSTTAATTVASTFTVGYEGADGDAADGLPVKVRFLFKPARVGVDGSWIDITTPYQYDQYVDELVAWDDPDWSSWTGYPADPAHRLVSFAEQPDGYYLFAVQTMDADGAVSTGRGYAAEVGHFEVRQGMFQPAVVLTEYYLGSVMVPPPSTFIAPGQPLNFSWSADASSYGGTIVSYRYGWDVIDPDDPNDPGWAAPPGLVTAAPERSFQEGVHAFILKVVDDSAQERVVQWTLSIVPFIDYNMQSELLLIDQTVDANVQNWQSQTGVPLNNEIYRNAFWQFLADGSGGVAGFDWNQDRVDHTEQVDFADLVAYKSVLCYAQANEAQLMFNQLRPLHDQDKYLWLVPYVERGGNLMLVGGSSMDSFLEMKPNYMTPIIFDTDEFTYVIGGQTFIVGFGSTELPDGSVVARGPRQYPYAAAGLATLDWTSASTKFIYARTNPMRWDRVVDCVGLKALVKDADFAAHWGVTAADFADTVATEATIDWQDAWYDANYDSIPVISNTFPFRDDEFVDANLSSRTTPWQPQLCDDPNAPNGRCVEPMFRGQSRLDWLREYHRAKGETDWPASQYSATEMDAMCGPLGLSDYEGQPKGTSVTNGQVYGWLSYKKTADKPSGAPDIYWGFDPYRFDHEQSRKMIRWALRSVFQLNVLD